MVVVSKSLCQILDAIDTNHSVRADLFWNIQFDRDLFLGQTIVLFEITDSWIIVALLKKVE